MKKKMREAKHFFIVRLSYLLTLDRNSEVKTVKYEYDGYDEFANIEFNGGHVVAVNITGGSLGEIYKAVGRAVYGE